jgi:RNA polymerase sigma factor (sigma-70 family)
VVDATLHEHESGTLVDFIRARAPACKLLLMVPSFAKDRMTDFAQLGGEGCVSEDDSLAVLDSAIRNVLAGKPFCSVELANALFAQVSRNERGGRRQEAFDHVRLTAREQEVLRLIAGEQLGNKQIARRLHVSLYTVKNHVHNIIEKLGANSRHEAAQLARRRQMLQNGPPA